MSAIRVLFVDADTGLPIAGSELAPDALPETFEVATVVQIHGEEYDVVSAEPATRAAIVAYGQVKITLRKVQRVDPRDLRFSLPTIADGLPELAEPAGDGGLRMRADDWCQIEFVPQAALAEVRRELAEIRAVYAEHPPGSGFTRLHARTLAQPLIGSGVTVADLRPVGTRHRVPLGVDGLDSVCREVAGGFVFEAQTAQLYGVSVDERVATLAWHAPRPPLACVAGCPAPVDLGADLAALTALCDRHALLLVDWCAAAILLPGVFADG